MSFNDFAGITVLCWFLEHPTKKLHLKELCRELDLGPLTVKTYCDEFFKIGWLMEERRANLRILWLNNESFVIKSMKRAYSLEKLRREKIEKIAGDGIISLALYGSHASGEYDERSDVDLLSIGRKEQINYTAIKALEKNIGKQVQLVVFPLDKWERNKHKDPFMLSVLKNHVVLKGAPL